MDPLSTLAALLFAALDAEIVDCPTALQTDRAAVCAEPSSGLSKTRLRFNDFADEHLPSERNPRADWRNEPGYRTIRLIKDGEAYELIWNGQERNLVLLDGHPCLEVDARVEAAPILKGRAPRYPDEARRLREDGEVWVDALVAEDGRIVDLCVVDSTSPIFEGSALRWAADLQIAPTTLDGEPITVIHPLYVAFAIQ